MAQPVTARIGDSSRKAHPGRALAAVLDGERHGAGLRALARVAVLLATASGLSAVPLSAQTCLRPGFVRPTVGLGGTTVGNDPRMVATGDLNGDGVPDALIVNRAADNVSVRLGIGTSPGNFTSPAPPEVAVGTGPTAIVAADFNHDGKLDFAVTNIGGGTVTVRFGNGNGTFGNTPTTLTNGLVAPIFLDAADFNRDGNLDLVVIDALALQAVVVFAGNGTGGFGVPTTFGAPGLNQVVAADLDRDGAVDIAVADGTLSGGVKVFPGSGGGAFAAPILFPGVGPSLGLAVADLNRDGRLDLVETSPGAGRVVVHLALSAGGFAPATAFPAGASPQLPAVADLDRDGNADLAVPDGAVGSTDVRLLYGDGTGDFPIASSFVLALSPPPAVSQPVAIAIADWNHDGRPDLGVVANVGTFFETFLNTFGIACGNTSFGPATRAFPGPEELMSAATADFNGDGKLDVVIGSNSGVANTKLYVELGNGYGGFGAPATFPNSATGFAIVATGDLNNDGKPDAVVGAGGFVRAFLGTGTGSLVGNAPTATTGSVPGSLALGDFNGDGKADVVVTLSLTSTLNVMLGTGGGGLNPPTALLLTGTTGTVTTGDFNGDGKLDIAATGGTTIHVFLGNGDGTFVGPVLTAGGATLGSLAAGDFNGDGRLDLVVGTATLTRIFAGLGTGLFSLSDTRPTGSSNYSVGDFNHDQKLDVAAIIGNGAGIFLGSGSGTLANPLSVPDTGDTVASLTSGDFTTDGNLDVVVVNRLSWNTWLYRGDGAGNLLGTPKVATFGLSGVVGDFNRDGLADVVVGSSGSLTFFPGSTTGLGSPLASPGSATVAELVAGDFNRDGRLDIVVSNGGSSTFTLFTGNGSGNFSGGVPVVINGSVLTALAAGDFDADGKIDLAIGDGTAGVRLVKGNGNGTFQAPTLLAGPLALALGLADVNGDGKLDLVIGSNSSLFLRLGDGTGGFGAFTSVTIPGSARGLVVADLNGDGKLDLATATGTGAAGTVAVALATAPGAFPAVATSYPAGGTPGAIVAGDFNRDGIVDLAVGNDAPSPAPHTIGVLRGAGNGTFLAADFYGLADNPAWLGVGDFQGDARHDVFAAGKTTASGLFLSTNCAKRTLGFLPGDVLPCNSPGLPLTAQPRPEVLDDGGNRLQCEAGVVVANLAPGTGNPLATLSGSLTLVPVLGLANYTDLSVDLPGRRYRLKFDYAGLPTARSRPFTLAPQVTITGPTSFCASSPVVYQSDAGFDTYAWNLDATPVGTLQNVTLSGVTAGVHLLSVIATQDTCSTSDTKTIEAYASLGSVVATASGTTTVCTTCLGGTATATEAGGGPILARQWLFATTSGGPYTQILGQTSGTYAIHGADFPGPGTYFLVERSTPTCGITLTSNEIPITVVAGDQGVQFFTATAKDKEVTLEWLNPDIGAAFGGTQIQMRSVPTSSTCAFPSGPGDGTTILPASFGTGPGQHDSFVHTVAANDNTTYCYAAYVAVLPGPTFSAGRFVKGRPFDTVGQVKWAYSTGASSLAPPSIGTNVIVVSNDRVVHSVQRGTGVLTGGYWPAAPLWWPAATNGLVQSRSPVVPTPAGPSSRSVFLGGQDGSIYAVDGDRGGSIKPPWPTAWAWRTPALGGGVVQAAPAGMFTAFGGTWDLLMVGTRTGGADNALYGLKPADGSVAWSTPYAGTGTDKIGIISGGASVDYATKRVYFASRERSAGKSTLWCLDFTDTGATLGWKLPLGDIDGSPVLRGGKVYVGTNGSLVHARDAATGVNPSSSWTYNAGAGPVKGFPFPDRFSNDLYFSTTTTVFGITDNGASVAPKWNTGAAIPNPSIPLFGRLGVNAFVWVGGSDGFLYQIDAATGGTIKSVKLGDGLAVAGAPSLDIANSVVYVGTEAGVVYAVQVPLP